MEIALKHKFSILEDYQIAISIELWDQGFIILEGKSIA